MKPWKRRSPPHWTQSPHRSLVTASATTATRSNDSAKRPSVRVHGIPDPLPPKRYGLAFLTELQPAEMPYCEALLKTLALASRLGVGWTISDPTPYQDGYVELSGMLAFPLRGAPDHTLASPEIGTGRFTLWDTQPAYANDQMHLRSPLAPARLK